MIRKILISISLIFVAGWFTGGHLIKSKIVSLIENLESDNVKITYEDVKISGFPRLWKISFTKPKVSLAGYFHEKEIASEKLDCFFDPSFKKVKLIFGKNIKQGQNLSDHKKEYIAHSSQNIEIQIKFIKPLYLASNNDSFSTFFKTIMFNNELLLVSDKNEEIFNLVEPIVFISKNSRNDSQNIWIKFHTEYKSKTQFMKFNNAKVDFDSIFTINTQNNEAKVNHFLFVTDESEIGLNGCMTLYKDQSPKGKFTVSLNNYGNLVDLIAPSNFIMPKPLLKRMIARAANPLDELTQDEIMLLNHDADAKFDVVFSKDGVKIGSINLFDFKAEE